MPASDVASQHQLAETRLSAAVLAATRKLWRSVDFANLDASWSAVERRATLYVAAGQLAAAQAAESYVDAVLTAQGIDTATVADLAPRAFAGASSSGGDLAGLLRQAPGLAKLAIANGRDPAEAMAAGESFLARAVTTQVHDAGRSAVAATMAARPAVITYTRQVSAGACDRCKVLSGRVYHWNTGFRRHPFCNCVHVPSEEPADEDGRRRPADGMYVPDEGFAATRLGTTRTGSFRTTPDAIISQAETKAEALERLQQHGYIRDLRTAASQPARQLDAPIGSVKLPASGLDPRAAKIADETKDVLDKIGTLHGTTPTMRPVEVRASPNLRLSQNANGMFTTDADGAPLAIRIDPAGDGRRFTIAHEYGHYLDSEMIGGAGSWASQFGEAPGVGDWLDAVYESDTVKHLTAIRSTLDANGKAYVDYLLDPREMWARSYSQWVAESLNDTDMLETIAGMAEHTQWPTDDFRLISEKVGQVMAQFKP